MMTDASKTPDGLEVINMLEHGQSGWPLMVRSDEHNGKVSALLAELEAAKAALENAPWKASYMDMRNQRDEANTRLASMVDTHELRCTFHGVLLAGEFHDISTINMAMADFDRVVEVVVEQREKA